MRKRQAIEISVAEANRLEAQYPYEPNAKVYCHEIAEAGEHSYCCTRRRGHKGPHIAHAPKGPVAYWPNNKE